LLKTIFKNLDFMLVLDMRLKSVYKIPNGKLLKVFLDYDPEKNLIKKISITGDFFVYPEETVELIEKELRGIRVDKDVLLSKIKSIIEREGIEFIGLDAEGLVEGIMLCVA